MKKKHILSLFLLAPVVLFFAGPRPSPDLTIRRTSLPNKPGDLDDFLHDSESSVPDIIDGAEKTIVWADPVKKERTPLSIVYLHGFSATRQEVAPLSDVVASRLGANLFYTRLRGHGQKGGSALGTVSVNDWIQDSVEALEIGKILGDRVIVVSTSTGSTLSAWLLSDVDRSDHVAASIMLSPNFAVKDKNARVALWPWGKQIIRTAVGKVHTWAPKNARQKKYWSTVYPIEAIVTMMSLVDVVGELDLGTHTVPSLVVYSEMDAVVSVEKIKEKFPEFGGSRNRLIALDTKDESRSHVLAGEIIAPEMTGVLADTIYTFLADVGVAGTAESIGENEQQGATDGDQGQARLDDSWTSLADR